LQTSTFGEDIQLFVGLERLLWPKENWN